MADPEELQELVEAAGGSLSHTFGDDVEVVYKNVPEREVPPWDELDPGIRGTVRWLYEHGFSPTDSGDGKAKFGEEGHPCGCALHKPHVFMVCGPDIMLEVDRLNDLLLGRGVRLRTGPETPEEAEEDGVDWEPTGEGEVWGNLEGSYRPGEPAIIMLWGVDDEVLDLVYRTPSLADEVTVTPQGSGE